MSAFREEEGKYNASHSLANAKTRTRIPRAKREDEDQDISSVVKKTYTVLSVDDDNVNQKVMENLLKAEGYTVIKAMSGRAALDIIDEAYRRCERERLENEQIEEDKPRESFFDVEGVDRDWGRNFLYRGLPDIILLDVMMPGISGFKVASTLRRRYPPPLLPIIMISEIATAASAQKGIRNGANEFLMKPISRFAKVELLSRIRTLIKLKQIWQLEQQAVERKQAETKCSPSLLPVHIMERIQEGKRDIVDIFPMITLARIGIEPENPEVELSLEWAHALDHFIRCLDKLTKEEESVTKVYVTGESYVASAGASGDRRHAHIMIRFVQKAAKRVEKWFSRMVGKEQVCGRGGGPLPVKVKLKIVLHSGRAKAGILGEIRPQYCLFGPSLRELSRLYEINSVIGCVVASPETIKCAANPFSFIPNPYHCYIHSFTDESPPNVHTVPPFGVPLSFIMPLTGSARQRLKQATLRTQQVQRIQLQYHQGSKLGGQDAQYDTNAGAKWKLSRISIPLESHQRIPFSDNMSPIIPNHRCSRPTSKPGSQSPHPCNLFSSFNDGHAHNACNSQPRLHARLSGNLINEESSYGRKLHLKEIYDCKDDSVNGEPQVRSSSTFASAGTPGEERTVQHHETPPTSLKRLDERLEAEMRLLMRDATSAATRVTREAMSSMVRVSSSSSMSAGFGRVQLHARTRSVASTNLLKRSLRTPQTPLSTEPRFM
mmetsp:Transcript_6608/g.9133  ORF Transcript_6608/g.9133 Transcript_6608/m.9133 type:complete len:718 (-) Transcript_6608:97-2250(-)